MPDEPEGSRDSAEEPLVAPPGDTEPRGDSTAEVAVRPVPAPPALAWRRRALAVRSTLPQLARHPVVVGASAAAATLAARVVLEVVRGAVTAPATRRPTVPGRSFHHVHVVHEVHVVHHVPQAVVLRALPRDPRR